jgi:protein TonB
MSSVSPGREEKTLVELSECLLGGDREQLSGEHRVRGEALLLSILFQMAVLAALVVVPLFGSVERIVLARAIVVCPVFSGRSAHLHLKTNMAEGHSSRRRTWHDVFTAPGHIPPTISPTGRHSHPEPIDDRSLGIGAGPILTEDYALPPGFAPGGLQLPEQPTQTTRKKPHFISHLNLGRLLYRVEPVYPSLALQTRREGRVEIVAVISTNGCIQSLEIVGGDPIFFQSARDAVSQWRFRPTILNSVPVEVETHIRVIYQLPH